MTIRTRSLASTALLALALAAPGLASAQTSGGGSSMSGDHGMSGSMSNHAMIDCANSHAMMAKLLNPSNGPFSSMSATADLDQNYGSSQMQIAKLQANLAKIELACGKDAKAKAAAQKALDDANAMESEINAMQHTN